MLKINVSWPCYFFVNNPTCVGAMTYLFLSHTCVSQNARFFQPIVVLQPKAAAQWNELNFGLVRNGMNSKIVSQNSRSGRLPKNEKGEGERGRPRRNFVLVMSVSFFFLNGAIRSEHEPAQLNSIELWTGLKFNGLACPHLRAFSPMAHSPRREARSLLWRFTNVAALCM